MSKLKIVQYGCGKMSKYTMRYALEKGAEIVGAFDIVESKFGMDISNIIGGEDTGIKIIDASNFDAFLKSNKVDAVMVTTMSLINDVKDALLICARNGVNAITICEEAFYPKNSNPTVFNEIDKLAKENNCTICGTGYQDVFWGNLIATICGATHKITNIKGKSSYNVEDYGIALAKGHGAGLTVEEFEKEIASVDNISEAEREKLIQNGEFLPSYMWNVNGWLCERLGLTIVKQIQKCVPQIARIDLDSSTLDMKIAKGKCSGMSAVVVTETAEGITIESECIGKVYEEDEFDCNDWTIMGEPTTQVTINRPDTVELTCATMVNRLPELIDAPSGYYTTNNMITNNYKSKSLETYLKK